MEKDSIEQAAGSSGLLSTGWFDPIETAIRDRVRGFIENLVAAELDEALGCGRYRRAKTTGWKGGPVTDTGVGNASCSAHSAR